jgi:hypothetical protein
VVKPTDYRLTQPLEQPLLVVTDAAAPHGLSATSARAIQMSPLPSRARAPTQTRKRSPALMLAFRLGLNRSVHHP